MAINKRFKRAWAECPKPKTSPWGEPQQCITFGPGIWEVSTASHGGIFLSEQRNAAVPYHMRSRNGWYEEDLDACIPMNVFPEEFRLNEKPERKEWAENAFRNNFPDHYEKWTGKTLKEGESRKRDEDTFAATVKGQLRVKTSYGDWANWVPNGMVGVVASVDGGPGPQSYFLLPKAEFDALSTPIGKVFPKDHKYKPADPYKTDNPFADKPKGDELIVPVHTRTVKVELLLTYDVADDDGGVRATPSRWNWSELLDLSHNESVQVLSEDQL